MTNHRIIFADSQQMSEGGDQSVHLVVTSPRSLKAAIPSATKSTRISSRLFGRSYLRTGWRDASLRRSRLSIDSARYWC